MYILKKENLKELLNLWSSVFEVYAPQETDEQTMLLPYEEDLLTLDYVNFAFPVKEYLFKQRERLFNWENNDRIIRTSSSGDLPINKRVFFGVRACDTYGIAYMDEFFLQGYKDDIYENNRETAYIVAMNCVEPGENCFCSSMGIGPFAIKGYDILFTPFQNEYLIEVGSEKGEELITIGKGLFSLAGDELLSEKNTITNGIAERFKTKLNAHDIRKILENNFDNSIWQQLSKDCVRCTGCTNLCPTCTCFNVVEEKTSSCSGCRVRYWDSCQSDSFTRNAGEHNPRNDVSRVRYRLYDKFKYIEEKFKFKGCTGCGRCINVCPASINVVDIINKLAKNDDINVNNKTETNTIEADNKAKSDNINVNSKVQDNNIKTNHKVENKDIEANRGSDYVTAHNHLHGESCEKVYTPQIAVIKDIIEETKNIKRFILQYEDKSLHENFKFGGQFFEITVFGVGEIAISIPFSSSVKDHFDFCIKKAGKVTSAIHNMKVGDKVGLRGPFGKGFPYENFVGRDVIIVGSGVGIAPVRTMIARIIENRQDFGKVVVIASAMSYEGLIYKEDLVSWSNVDNVRVLYALSNPTDKVEAHVGYINDLLPDLGLDWENTSSIICASPRRIKAVAKDLLKLGMKSIDIYTSLETHMRCGIGKCGHCKVGSKYMCVDGPVFNYEEMLTLPPEF